VTVNFQFLPQDLVSTRTVEDHYKWLTSPDVTGWRHLDPNRTPPEGYEAYHCIDVSGPDLVWLNKVFPQERFTWYAWFESVFLVPDAMYSFLVLKWA
jgi:hypothetical protein